ncbi:winged helix-turn-helix domain-containing protein [Streptomyces sp. Ag109_O5-1]|uniref:winged helix-turn-helix domain-containing protein n=1 Tax=Streptomyces sp. Ag109_O5-1 TaxID=1938851 RepID=UPI000F4EE638|nr:winged helix-turn-helix domain-containing protein [Streptomyces sp. Ag109_O5-1]
MTNRTAGGAGAFQRVSEELRVRLSDGAYPLNSFLPSQGSLAEEFGVARDTVQRALRELSSEGWIESGRGKRSRVVMRQHIQSSAPRASRSRHHPVTLGPLIGEAFEREEVTLDIYTLTSESLDAHIRIQAERIRAGDISPRRIALRMILPAEGQSMPYPRASGDRDDPRLPKRLHAITDAHTSSLRTVLGQLRAEKLVPEVELEVRHAELTPTFKLYVINHDEVLHGFYEPVRRRVILDDGTEVEAVDVLGFGASLTHHVRDANATSPGSTFVANTTRWFESVWALLAT